MRPNLEIIDYVIIIAYMIFALGVGVVLSKRASESSENYFLAGRNLPWWLVGISMIATSYASDTPLAVTEMIREHGLQRLWWFLSGCIGASTGIFLFSRLWRRAEITTDAELYEMRYDGKSAAFLRFFKAAFNGTINNFIIMAWVTLAMSSVIATLTPFDQYTAIIVCVSVALVYSVMSGFYGVIVTDLVQFFIAVGGMLFLTVIAWTSVGGYEVIAERISASEGHGPEALNLFPDFSHLDMDVFTLAVFVGLLWWNDAGGYHMQRMSSCKNEKHSILAILFFGVFQTSRAWLWVGVALVSIVLFPDLSHTPFGDTQGYPMVMNTYLVPGMKGVLVTAFLAAYMSTIDTHLNWGASYVMTDIYRRFIKKKASEKHYMMVTKIVVVLLMLCAAAIVPFMTSVTAAWQFLALLLCGSQLICFLRWFWWRINAFTEISALIVACCLAVANLLLTSFWPQTVVFGVPWSEFPFALKFALFMAIIMPIALTVTFLTPPVPVEKLESFYRKVRPGGAWGVLSPEIRRLKGKALSLRTILDFCAGICLTFGISLGIGHVMLHRYAIGIGCFVAAAVGAVWIYFWFNREVKLIEQDDT